mmetsp:Transcript_10277/g.8831  ORF Transcript_10277/g.8831 Transcript_10277/m.8831 type:complete len:218 (-) Transcript_10277:131-784(-)
MGLLIKQTSGSSRQLSISQDLSSILLIKLLLLLSIHGMVTCTIGISNILHLVTFSLNFISKFLIFLLLLGHLGFDLLLLKRIFIGVLSRLNFSNNIYLVLNLLNTVSTISGYPTLGDLIEDHTSSFLVLYTLILGKFLPSGQCLLFRDLLMSGEFGSSSRKIDIETRLSIIDDSVFVGNGFFFVVFHVLEGVQILQKSLDIVLGKLVIVFVEFLINL